jgi:hypothetical protein
LGFQALMLGSWVESLRDVEPKPSPFYGCTFLKPASFPEVVLSQVSWFVVRGFRFWVSGLWFRVPGFGCRVQGWSPTPRSCQTTSWE